MDSNESLESTSITNWKTVTDLFEQVFGPDSESNENENNSHENDSCSLGNKNASTSYVTLNTSNQHLDILPQVSFHTDQHTIDEFQQHSSDLHRPSTSIYDLSHRNVQLMLDNAQSSQPIEKTVRCQAVSQPFLIPHRALLRTDEQIAVKEFSNTLHSDIHTERDHSSNLQDLHNSCDSNGHQTYQPSIQNKIDEKNEKENIVTPTISMKNQGVKLCLNGMEFNISNNSRNGECLINIEMKLPNRSSSKQDTTTNKKYKHEGKTKNEIENNDDYSLNDSLNDSSVNSSDDFSSQQELIGVQKEVKSSLLTPKIKQTEKNLFTVTKLQNNIKDVEERKLSHHLEHENSSCQKRKLPAEEIESSENCRVCGDESSKFIHYGGRSCQSCRAFFRRTVEKQRQRPWLRLVCSCKEECAVKNRVLCSKGVHQRKSCKYCRFERCQSLAGLERKWVISGHITTVENCKRSRSESHTE